MRPFTYCYECQGYSSSTIIQQTPCTLCNGHKCFNHGGKEMFSHGVCGAIDICIDCYAHRKCCEELNKTEKATETKIEEQKKEAQKATKTTKEMKEENKKEATETTKQVKEEERNNLLAVGEIFEVQLITKLGEINITNRFALGILNLP